MIQRELPTKDPLHEIHQSLWMIQRESMTCACREHQRRQWRQAVKTATPSGAPASPPPPRKLPSQSRTTHPQAPARAAAMHCHNGRTRIGRRIWPPHLAGRAGGTDQHARQIRAPVAEAGRMRQVRAQRLPGKPRARTARTGGRGAEMSTGTAPSIASGVRQRLTKACCLPLLCSVRPFYPF